MFSESRSLGQKTNITSPCTYSALHIYSNLHLRCVSDVRLCTVERVWRRIQALPPCLSCGYVRSTTQTTTLAHPITTQYTLRKSRLCIAFVRVTTLLAVLLSPLHVMALSKTTDTWRACRATAQIRLQFVTQLKHTLALRSMETGVNPKNCLMRKVCFLATVSVFFHR
jgi:predicted Na+-dependent transporter